MVHSLGVHPKKKKLVIVFDLYVTIYIVCVVGGLSFMYGEALCGGPHSSPRCW